MSTQDLSLYENEPLERLVKILDELEKDNETIRRENSLFESYHKRLYRAPVEEFKEEVKETEKRGKLRKRGQQQVEEVKTLSIQEKYDIANNELEELQKSIQDNQQRSDEKLEELKARLDEIDMKIAEIKREAHEFKRDIVMSSENSRTGKIVAEKLESYIEERLKQKQLAIDKLKKQNEELEKKKKNEKKKIVKKEQTSDNLEFVDFHQLQIENKKLVAQIDERNKDLLSLKKTYGKCTFKLTNIKEELSKEEQELLEINLKIKDSKHEILENHKEIAKVDGNIRKIKKKIRKFGQQKTEVDNLPSVTEYIDWKDQQDKLQQQVKTLERKIKIAEPNYHHALKVLNYKTS